MDIFQIEILEDGTASIKTDEISEANHASADDLLALLEEELGSMRQTVQREGKVHSHADHHHAHAHHHKAKA